ncbi:replication-associated recombination protein A [candidate division WOR-3 bacterium]|nr:replication-associated recombination protein A [candidate division WOR-3 bacterium]
MSPPIDSPLADRMRPQTLDEIVGQDHLLGKDKPLRRMIEKGELHSMILWGPPGSGKTTLALAIAHYTRAIFIQLSAVTSSVAEVREITRRAEFERSMHNRRTILFVDEIHRFNKAQQDAFLPHVESGGIILIGATTENPSFEVIAPLLSRCRVYVLNQLSPDDVKTVMRRAMQAEQGLAPLRPEVPEEVLDYLVVVSQGDARAALTALELCVASAEPSKRGVQAVTLDLAQDVVQRKFLLYDKSGEEHFNLISALHKSLRDSDPDGALYWLARMLEAGEDPLYVARRLVRFASEDVGLAQPNALLIANAAKDAVHFIGMPEGNTALAQCVVYLALAPKSNALYVAYGEAKNDALKSATEPVPLHLRNAPTGLMKGLGYGKGYKYAHDFKDAKVEQEHLPPSLRGRKYYRPTDRGFEAELKKREQPRTDIEPRKHEGHETNG